MNGPRHKSYGHPQEAFTRIGRMWGAILGTEDISPERVGLCMIAMKVSREVGGHKDDTLDDIEGYVECLRMLQ